MYLTSSILKFKIFNIKSVIESNLNIQLPFFVTEISNKRTNWRRVLGSFRVRSKMSERVLCGNAVSAIFCKGGGVGTGGHLPLQNLLWYSHLHSCCNWTTRLLRPRISRLPEMPSLKCVEYYLDRDCIISCGIPRVQLVWRANNFCRPILVCTKVSPLFIFELKEYYFHSLQSKLSKHR